jgi:hypothetical protein
LNACLPLFCFGYDLGFESNLSNRGSYTALQGHSYVSYEALKGVIRFLRVLEGLEGHYISPGGPCKALKSMRKLSRALEALAGFIRGLKDIASGTPSI